MRQHRREADRRDRHQHERDACSTFAKRHQRRHRAMLAASSRRCNARRRRGLLDAGDRAYQPRHVAAHAEALVANPVALAEVLSAARTRERNRAKQQRKPQFARKRADAGQALRQCAPACHALMAKTIASAPSSATAATLTKINRSSAT